MTSILIDTVHPDPAAPEGERPDPFRPTGPRHDDRRPPVTMAQVLHALGQLLTDTADHVAALPDAAIDALLADLIDAAVAAGVRTGLRAPTAEDSAVMRTRTLARLAECTVSREIVLAATPAQKALDLLPAR